MDAILQREEITHILNGPDYFVCERMHCRLKKTDCASRQSKGNGETAEKGRRTVPYECQNCEQGKEILAELEAGGTKEESMAKKGTCINCERPDMYLPGGGLCGTCYETSKGLNGDERDKALAEVNKRILEGKLRGSRGTAKGNGGKPAKGNGSGKGLYLKVGESIDSGNYERLGRFVGALVDKKQAAYGDAFGKSGDVLRQLYPECIKPHQYGDVLTLARIIDKMFRIATGKDPFGEDPYMDIAGYGLLGAGLGKDPHPHSIESATDGGKDEPPH